MKVILLGGAGFIGTNLAIKLSENCLNEITIVDRSESSFETLKKINIRNATYICSEFNIATDFEYILKGQDVVYHLVSTTVPTTSNQHISEELMANVVATSRMLDACVRTEVKKVIFVSSGGTVYGKEVECPISEDTPTNPISSYGVQKIAIEKLLYLYNYMYGLDYRIIRLANPYGPYQCPNGVLGAVTTFTYKALRKEKIIVYGDGSVVRDYIYIDDAVRAIQNIVNGESKYRIFNLGCGYGTSINAVLECISSALKCEMDTVYREGRMVDVPANYLDISRYEKCYGELNPISLQEGILKTAEYMKKEMLQ